MRVLSSLVVILICVVVHHAQDGGDMLYVDRDEIGKEHVGKRVHIDFYRKTTGNYYSAEAAVDFDQVRLRVGGRQVQFVEHRTDDGLNNWFSQQYLESIDKKIRIREFKLLGFDERGVRVKAYLNIRPFEIEFVFQKADIAQFLIKVE